jgi:polysaccharide export outer membrane protein
VKKVGYLLIFFVLLSFNAFAKDYVIGDGDTLQISVWGSPELSLEVTVRPDGKISMPALGEIKASGLTPEELKNILGKRLADFVKNPFTTVIVTGMMNYQVLVFGNGTNPGIHTLQKKTSLLQFLSILGPLDNADLNKAYLVRNNKKIKTGFYGLFRKGDINQDINLEPNDVLFIPDNFEKRISVVGAITTPSAIPYREGLTVLDIILSVGGFTEFANKNDVEILRKNGGEEREKISVKAKDLMRGDLSKNIGISPGDIVVVKESLF